MFWLAKWGTDTSIDFSMIKRGVVDLAGTADWTPATGDVKRSLNGGTMANTTNLPTAIAGAGSVGWRLTLNGTAELQTPQVYVQIVDAATKAVEDNSFIVYTYGNASAKIAADLSDITRLGLLTLPNAAAEAAGGMYTRGTGAGQINQPANGMIDSNVVRWLNSVVNALLTGRVDASVGAYPGNTPQTGDNFVKTSQLVFTTTNRVDSTVVDKTGFALSTAGNTAVRDAVTDDIIETQGSISLQRALSIILAVVAGRTDTGGLVFRSPDAGAIRVTATVDASNNRTGITITPSA